MGRRLGNIIGYKVCATVEVDGVAARRQVGRQYQTKAAAAELRDLAAFTYPDAEVEAVTRRDGSEIV